MKRKLVIIWISVTLAILFPLSAAFILNNRSRQQQDLRNLYNSQYIKQYNKQNEILADHLFKNSMPQTEWSKLNCQERESFLERLIMLNYVPQMKEAVDNYYKELRGFDLVGIEDVKTVSPYEYEMKVQISTYVGAHNPPYGSDIATIHFNKLCDGNVVDFQHKDE